MLVKTLDRESKEHVLYLDTAVRLDLSPTIQDIAAGEYRDKTADHIKGSGYSDRRFFMPCRECGEKQPKGWMHDSKICQCCASKNHGVVY